MIIREIFEKPIDRTIDGVIKADDETHIFDEVYEYVLTNEISKNLGTLLDRYNNPNDVANGVWISGFFGSGKSHLLKMLSLLFENRKLEGAVSVEEIFLEKTDDEFLKNEIKKACSQSSKNILFNIDQKADVVSKDQADAVVSVFKRVFDEMQGYFGKQGYIADFERDLDDLELYTRFKEEFSKHANTSWEDARDLIWMYNDQVAEALSTVKDISTESAAQLIDKYQQDYKLSITDFADQVKKYIDKQPADFRLNFFVDEVGQYIAENTKLMLNLQTLAETLNTKCDRKAWIYATSQQDLNTLIGDMEAKQGNDFSRIQERFVIRMPLNSADVAEVIQKRLLSKNDDGKPVVDALYQQYSPGFKALFTFSSDSRQYRLYRHENHFQDCYPFIPYQFDLFQSSIIGISQHNGFEGHHRSVGERSMLSVFQDVTKFLSDNETGSIAPFDRMFEGIRKSLKSEIQVSVLAAERSPLSEFDIRVLKALFLVKFIREFKAKPENIAILLLASYATDFKNHLVQVKEALNNLELQTYIQRTGDVYEYLTDDEKAIESEIKNIELEVQDKNKYLKDLIYGTIIKEQKIRYTPNSFDYPFTQKIDDIIMSPRQHELGINILTDIDDDQTTSLPAAKSMGTGDLVITLKSDRQFSHDLAMVLKTEKYLRINSSASVSENRQKLLMLKGKQNEERRKQITQAVQELVASGAYWVNGSPVQATSSDGRTAVITAFQELIQTFYPNIGMVSGRLTEKAIPSILKSNDASLFGDDPNIIGPAENEMLSIIRRKSQSGERVSLKTLLQLFSARPYGWPPAAIKCVAARLFIDAQIEIKQDSQLLDASFVQKNILNSQYYDNTMFECIEIFNPKEVSDLKEFHQDFFHEPNSGSDARAIADITLVKIKDLKTDLEEYYRESNNYPFMKRLKQPIECLQELARKDYKYFLKNLSDFKDDLLDLREDIIDPLVNFMTNTNFRSTYDDIINFVEQNRANVSYLESSQELANVLAARENVDIYKARVIQALKKDITKVKASINEVISKKKADGKDEIEKLKTKLQAMPNFSNLDDASKQQVMAPFEQVANDITGQCLISVINDKLRNTEERLYQQQVDLIDQLTAPKPSAGAPLPATPTITSVNIKSIKVNYSKPFIETSKDIDEYLDMLKTQMEQQLNQAHRIIV